MSIRLGLLSDVHASPEPVNEALDIFTREGVEVILCPGDIAGYYDELDETIALLQQTGCHIVRGNHDRWFVEENTGNWHSLAFLRRLPTALSFTIEGIKLYLVHASPPDSDMEGIRLLDEHGERIPQALHQWADRLANFHHDILVVGHTHQVFAEQLAGTLVINPGSTTFNHSCATLHLPSCHIEWYPLGGEAMVRSWNWGRFYRRP